MIVLDVMNKEVKSSNLKYVSKLATSRYERSNYPLYRYSFPFF